MEKEILELLSDAVSVHHIGAERIMQTIQYHPNNSDELSTWMYNWYFGLGIESVIGRKFELSHCPFSDSEVLEANTNNEIILCVPKNVNRKQLGELFRLDSWALADKLVKDSIEREDFWFKTSKQMIPNKMRQSGIATLNEINKNKQVHFSIERYLVFLATMKTITGEYPDREFWVWMTGSRYDRSGMLIAGFDRHKNFSVHGWMPQFEASFVGVRYGVLPSFISDKKDW